MSDQIPYPKLVTAGDGTRVQVNNAAEETAALARAPLAGPKIRLPTSPPMTQHIVAVLVLFAFAGMIAALSWHSVPAENKDAMETVLGVLGGAFTMVVNFYFGSTSTSREKDQTINQLSGDGK